MFAFSCLGDPDIRQMAGPSGHLAGSTTAIRGFLRWWLCHADTPLRSSRLHRIERPCLGGGTMAIRFRQIDEQAAKNG
jgi:hypothetical protein